MEENQKRNAMTTDQMTIGTRMIIKVEDHPSFAFRNGWDS